MAWTIEDVPEGRRARCSCGCAITGARDADLSTAMRVHDQFCGKPSVPGTRVPRPDRLS